MSMSTYMTTSTTMSNVYVYV